MKKLILFFCLIIAAGCSQAQDTVDNAKIQNIPPFKVLRTDSTWFTPANLKKHKPVMIIYFSPDHSLDKLWYLHSWNEAAITLFEVQENGAQYASAPAGIRL